MSGNDVFARKKALKERTFGRDFLCLKRVLFSFSLYQFGALGTLYKMVWRNYEILVFSSLRTRGQKVSSDRAQPPPKIQAAKRAAFIFGERSRKASLHAFGNLPHKRQSQKLFTQKTKVFLHIFTKAPKPCLWSRSATGLVPCVPQAQCVIASLVKRSAYAAREISPWRE